ncbi:MAG TPA: AAA family ATPase, partial [Nannocystis sp.]
RSPYGFRYPYQAMAIKATLLDSAGQRIELVRRKKRKDALLGNLRTDAGEVTLDEPRFRRYFGALTEELYKAVFGFTHTDLQQGADVLKVAGLGELLGGGALGGGAEVVRRVLGELRDEGEALFKSRGKNPPINRNLAQLRDARNSLREATYQQPQYLALTQALREAREVLATADTELSRLRLRGARVQTLLNTFEDFHEHQRLRARLADPGLATPLQPADAERVRPLLTDLRAREQRHQALTDELERLERRAAQHPVDHALLVEAAAVDRLLRRVEPIAAQRRELPRERDRLEREREALREQFDRLSHGTAALSPGTAPAAISAAELEQVRVALGRWRRARQELQVLARGEADDEAELTALRTEAALLADQAPDERGAALLAELERAQADHAELERGERELARLDAEIDLLLARLHPRPTGPLDRLPLPGFATVQDMQSRHLDRERERRDAHEHFSQQTSELAQIETEIAAVTGEDLPDPAQLAEARRRRDETWATVRQQLLARGTTPQRDLFSPTEPGLPEPAPRVGDRRTLARGFERALADADQLADRLRASADRLAQRTALTHTAERARVALTRARERLASLDAAERAWTAEWAELWRPTGVPPESPRSMLAWLGDATTLRDLAAQRARREHGLAPLRPQVRYFEARLRDHLGPSAPHTATTAANTSPATTPPSHDAGSPAPRGVAAYLSPSTSPTSHAAHFAAAASAYTTSSPALTWPALVAQLRERERVAQTRRGRLESTQARATALAAALARTTTARSFLERDLATAADDLRRRTAALGLAADLDPETAVERLEALADLSERLSSNELRRTACEQALAALTTFDAEVAALHARLARAPDPGDPPEQQVERLSRALASAREAATTHALARDEAADKRTEQQRLAAALADARGEYEALLARAGVHDEAALSAMAERTLLRDQLTRSCADLDLRLARALGEGDAREAYEAELRASRREALVSEQQTLTREISELDQRRISAALAKGRHEHEAQQLGGDRAARVGAEIEVIKSELEEQIDRYLLVHLAERVLDRVTDRYARENQPAILQYTSELLARITEGRHLRVVVQPETRSLATVDRQGQLRQPGDLSTGTREQMFLAQRLAYILDHCDRSEPLPVIMDDVLVNFDDARAAASLATLRDAARATQVILLTCHRRWLEIARTVAPDARILELPAESPPAGVLRTAEA